MAGRIIKIKGFSVKDGKVKPIPGYGLGKSAQIRQRSSKKVRVQRKKI